MPASNPSLSNIMNYGATGGAPLANLLGGDAATWGGAYQNSEGTWVQDITDNEGNVHQQNLQDQLTPAQWTNFQNQLKGGYITPETTSGSSDSGTAGHSVMTTNISALPKVLGQYTVNPNAQNAGFGWTNLGTDKNAGPNLSQVKDQSQVKWDPNYGWITQVANTHYGDENFLDKTMDVVSQIVPSLIPMVLAGPLGALGGSQLLFSLPGAISGAMNKDWGQLISAGLTAGGLPSWLASGAKTGYELSEGRGRDPLSEGMTLARILQGLGNG